MRVAHYFDYKSPYAYLAQEESLALAELPGVEFALVPYTLDIPDYLGRAEVGEDGTLRVDERTPHQWRRVRYAYRDCRREAGRRGLELRGPRRIFDSSVAHIGFLWARRGGDPRSYHDEVYARFWRRALDVGDADAVAQVLADTGFDPTGFDAFLAGEGRAEHDRLREEAHGAGVFGVPSYLVEGELYFGTERIPRVREKLGAA
jgi:2-hydroxychromene-2-carboxylate isomerase